MASTHSSQDMVAGLLNVSVTSSSESIAMVETTIWNTSSSMTTPAASVAYSTPQHIVGVREWYSIMGVWLEFRAAQGLWFYYHALFIVLGIIGNILSFVVLTNRKMRTNSTSYYLAALALFDLTFVLFGMLPNWVEELLFLVDVIWEHNMYVAQGWCQVHNVVTNTSRYLSAWTVVVYTIERFISVQYPLHARSLCTIPIAKRVIGCLTLFFLLGNSHFIFTFRSGLSETSQEYSRSTRFTAMPCESIYPAMNEIWNWVEFITMIALPFSIVLVFNLFIIRKVWQFRRARSKMASDEIKTSSSRSTENKLTVMLLVVSSYFLLSTCPRYTFLFYEKTHPWEGFNHVAAIRRLISQITLMLLQSNHVVNFFLYAISGGKFRKIFLGILCGRCRPGLADASDAAAILYTTHSTAGTLDGGRIDGGRRGSGVNNPVFTQEPKININSEVTKL